MNTEENVIEPERCVIVVNDGLPPGKAANAAAVIAFTLGQRHGQLVGAQLVDGDNGVHPGLIPIGIPVLRATAQQLSELRARTAPGSAISDIGGTHELAPDSTGLYLI